MYGHDRKVTRIDKLDEPKRVGIYCRVSSYNKDQIHSLLNQISFLTAEAGSNPDFRIVGIYRCLYRVVRNRPCRVPAPSGRLSRG